MKNLITCLCIFLLLTVLLLGIASCDKAVDEITPINKEAIFKQLQTKLSYDSSNGQFSILKQTNNSDWPEEGDKIYIQYKKPGGANAFTSGTFTMFKDNSSVFSFIASSGLSTYYVLGNKDPLIDVTVENCNTFATDYEFESYKAAAYIDASDPALEGHYDWKPNGGCAYAGIYDVNSPSCSGAPFPTCPYTDPKIVLFHKSSKLVLYLNWY